MSFSLESPIHAPKIWVIENGTIWSIPYDFLLAFHSNYGAILYRLRDIASYWSKIEKFLYPTCIQRPRKGCPRRNFAKMLIVIKLEWLGYRVVKNLWQCVQPFPLKGIEICAIQKLSYGFLFAFYSNYGRICSRLWDIQCQWMAWPWKTGMGSFKVIENSAVQ